MEAVGGASAVLAVAQVGFTLARALSTYIGDYKDARESIINLAGELDTTITQINELNALVANKETSLLLSEDSRKLAEQCVNHSNRLVKKLVHLLTKAQLPEDPSKIIIQPEDISVNRLTRAYWPWIKPQVDVVKSELFVMKQNILLARSCIESRKGDTPALKSAGEASIVAHAKSLHLARQVLKKAKAAEQRAKLEQRNLTMAPPPPESGARVAHGRVQDGGGSRRRPTDFRAGSHHSLSPARRPRATHGKYHRHSIAADDGDDSEIMAKDLRNTILQDIEREQAENAKQKIIEEKKRQLAVELYQTDIRKKLKEIEAGISETRDQLSQKFGTSLDEKQVEEFLDEQKKRQMHDEFGELLISIGVGPTLRPETPATGDQVDVEENSTRKSWRRRLFFRRRPLSSTSSDIHRISNVPSDPSSRKRARFLHVAMSHDSMKDKYHYLKLDNPALQHQPCGPSCDIETSMRAWQAISRSAKSAVTKWIDDNMDDSDWCLHAVVPVANRTHRTRAFLQKAILGAPIQPNMSSVLLVFTTAGTYSASDVATLARVADTRWESPYPALPAADGATPQAEIPKAEIQQIRDWLIGKGLSTAKLDELENVMARKDGENPFNNVQDMHDALPAKFGPPPTGAIPVPPDPYNYQPETTSYYPSQAVPYNPFQPNPGVFPQPAQQLYNEPWEPVTGDGIRARHAPKTTEDILRHEMREAVRQALADDKVLNRWSIGGSGSTGSPGSAAQDDFWSNPGSSDGRRSNYSTTGSALERHFSDQPLDRPRNSSGAEEYVDEGKQRYNPERDRDRDSRPRRLIHMRDIFSDPQKANEAADKRPMPRERLRVVTYEDEERASRDLNPLSFFEQGGSSSALDRHLPSSSRVGGRVATDHHKRESGPESQSVTGINLRATTETGGSKGKHTLYRSLEPIPDPILEEPDNDEPMGGAEDGEDAEDFMLDDSMLKNKMLVKYTGGFVNSADPSLGTDASIIPEQQHRTSDNGPPADPSSSDGRSPGVQRQHTATVEDLKEDDAHASSVGMGAHDDTMSPSPSPKLSAEHRR